MHGIFLIKGNAGFISSAVVVTRGLIKEWLRAPGLEDLVRSAAHNSEALISSNTWSCIYLPLSDVYV